VGADQLRREREGRRRRRGKEGGKDLCTKTIIHPFLLRVLTVS
jgi:hypothetical protein